MATNPIPWKSDQLYAVTLDSWDPQQPNDRNRPEMPPAQLTTATRLALAAIGHPVRTRGHVQAGARARLAVSRVARRSARILASRTASFFPMFDTPFLYGSGWDGAADAGPEPVVVLSKETNEKTFGGENSVGRMLSVGGHEMRVVGVLDDWVPGPKFYDLNNGPFQEPEDVYMPFRWAVDLEFGQVGNTNCWKSERIESSPGLPELRVRLGADVGRAADDARTRERYQAYLDNYAREQKAAGRMARPLNNQLFNVDALARFQPGGARRTTAC